MLRANDVVVTHVDRECCICPTIWDFLHAIRIMSLSTIQQDRSMLLI